MIETKRFTAIEFNTIRRSLYLSQSEFAQLLGKHQQEIARWENGQYSPNLSTRKKIAELYTSIYKQAMRYVAGVWFDKDAFLVVYPDDIKDTSSKRLAFLHLSRKNIACHLVVWNEKDFKEKYGELKDTPSLRTRWARDYYTNKRHLPPRKKRGEETYEYPWLSDWDE